MDLLTALQVIQTREYLAIYFKSQERNEEEKLFGKKINLRVMGSKPHVGWFGVNFGR